MIVFVDSTPKSVQKLKKKIAKFTDVIQSNLVPQVLSVAYECRGTLYVANEQYDLAMADFDKILEINANAARAYALKAGVYYLQGDLEQWRKNYYDGAIENFNQRLIPLGKNPSKYFLQPNDAVTVMRIYLARGRCYHIKGEFGLAISDYEMALQFDKKNFTKLKPGIEGWIQLAQQGEKITWD